MTNLTGLYNRRYWFNEGKKWFEEHQRQQTPFTLRVLVLCHLTRLLTQFFPDAMIARFGGEEFAMMVPHCTVPVLIKRLEGLRQQPLSPEIPLFVRASYSVISVVRVSMDEALSEADRPLYQAKNTRRDKILSQETAI